METTDYAAPMELWGIGLCFTIRIYPLWGNRVLEFVN